MARSTETPRKYLFTLRYLRFSATMPPRIIGDHRIVAEREDAAKSEAIRLAPLNEKSNGFRLMRGMHQIMECRLPEAEAC